MDFSSKLFPTFWQNLKLTFFEGIGDRSESLQRCIFDFSRSIQSFASAAEVFIKLIFQFLYW